MRTMRFAVLAVAAVVAGGGLAACSGGNDKDAAPTGGEPIIVTATDSTCEVGTTDVKAGTVVFKVTNKGSKVNEFYVYAAGDKVMGEVENIAPGLTRELRVELPAGSYETACKPGMSGRGIRGTLKVSGSAAAAAAASPPTQRRALLHRLPAGPAQAVRADPDATGAS